MLFASVLHPRGGSSIAPFDATEGAMPDRFRPERGGGRHIGLQVTNERKGVKTPLKEPASSALAPSTAMRFSRSVVLSRMAWLSRSSYEPKSTNKLSGKRGLGLAA